MKDALIERIRERENELEKQRLIHEMRLKETELQKLLSGLNKQEFEVPEQGKWKIQSQILGDNPVPKGEWIFPSNLRKLFLFKIEMFCYRLRVLFGGGGGKNFFFFF